MNPFFSLLGGVAMLGGKMSRFSINMVPSNWIVIGAGGAFGWGLISSALKNHDAASIAFGLAMWLVAALFLSSSLLRHTVFQAKSGTPVATSGGAPSSGVAPSGDLRFTGKLRLQEKVARRFLDVPAQGVELENGAFAFASNIDASSRMYGVVTNARRGMWLSVPRQGTVQMQDGLFYHGLRGVPALKVRYVDELDGSNSSAVIAFDSPADREALRARLSGAGSPANSPFQPLS